MNSSVAGITEAIHQLLFEFILNKSVRLFRFTAILPPKLCRPVGRLWVFFNVGNDSLPSHYITHEIQSLENRRWNPLCFIGRHFGVSGDERK